MDAKIRGARVILQFYIALLPLLHVSLCFPPVEAGSAEMARDCTAQNSYLWQVHVEPPVFLYGTMHVPYNKIWDDLSSNVKNAFSSSERLYVELLLSDSETLSQLSDCQTLPRSLPLDTVLSAETQERITNYLEHVRTIFPSWLQTSSLFGAGGGSQYSNYLFNAIVGNWREKRPIWVLFLLNSLTEENIRLRNIPLLDMFLDNAASGLGHEVVALETTRDQCRPLNNLNNDEVELALNVQLEYLEELLNSNQAASSVDSDVYTYRCGDFSKLVSSRPILPLPPLANLTSRVSPEEYDTLLAMESYLNNQFVTRRNRKIVQTIHSLLLSERQSNYFIALGAGHMVGAKNIVSRLRRKGYTVEHIQADMTIDGPTLPSDIINQGHPGAIPRLMRLEPVVTEPDLLPPLSPEVVASIWKDIFEQYVEPSRLSDTPSPSGSEGAHDVRKRQLTFGGHMRLLATTIPIDSAEFSSFDSTLWNRSCSVGLCHSVTVLLLFAVLVLLLL